MNMAEQEYLYIIYIFIYYIWLYISFSRGSPYWFPEWLNQFRIPPTVSDSFFPHIFSSIFCCYFVFVFYHCHSVWGETKISVLFLICVSSIVRDNEYFLKIFLCYYQFFVSPLERTLSLDYEPVFWMGCLFFWVLIIFWILTIYQMYS